MRNLLLVACIVILIPSGCSSYLGVGGAAEKHPIVGTWEGKDFLGQTMEIELARDGKFSLTVTGRQEFQKHGTYTFDESKTPHHLNIKLNDRDEIKTIFEMRGDDILIFENTNSSGSRPTEFGEYKMEMKRQ